MIVSRRRFLGSLCALPAIAKPSTSRPNILVRDGKWKLTAMNPKGDWELYDMEADRSEMHNLAAAYQDRVHRLANAWDQWARQNQVVPCIWDPPYKLMSASR